MNSFATVLLLLAARADAFAPPALPLASPRRTRARPATVAVALLPPDASLLLADAAAAVADAAGDAAAYVPSADVAGDFVAAATPSAEFAPTYSNWSYYTTLGLYALSFPGLWSQVKRSTKAKVKRKTYVSDGEAAEGGKELRQQAGEIMAYMKANNYEVADAGETITFRGLVARSVSQASFITFCTVVGMASLALVLQIQLQDLVLPVLGHPNFYYLVLLSPYAGIYYWRSGDRVDDVKVKLAASDDDTLNEVTIEGNDEEIDRMWRTLDLREKGMVKVEGILG